MSQEKSPFRLDAAERFLTLSHLLDDVPAAAGGELARSVGSACFFVIRNMRGKATDIEARYAVDRLRDELRRVLAATTPISDAAAVSTPWPFWGTCIDCPRDPEGNRRPWACRFAQETSHRYPMPPGSR